MNTNPNITVYGAYWCPDCRRSKRFLSEHQIAYHWIDIEQDEQARKHVMDLNNGKRIIPTIVFEDDTFLTEPSNAQLAQKLNLAQRDPHDYHDVTIIGAGPAGLTAAIYAARDGFQVMVIDEGALGGQATTTEMLDNYPGFPDGIRGKEWADRVVKQAQRFGVEFLRAQTVIGLEQVNNALCLKMGDGTEYGSGTVLIATGADYRRLGIEGEEDFIGAGVHFCSTCDGPFYKNKEVIVVGGGNSAVEESLGLLRFVNKVTLLVRGEKLKASKLLIDNVTTDQRVTIHYNTAVTKLAGQGGQLNAVHTQNTQTGEEEVFYPDGMFIYIGQQPNTAFLTSSGIILDDYGYILTGHRLNHHPQWHKNHTPEVLESSLPGVYAAGDVRAGATNQVAAAAGEGATAALLMREYLNEH